MKAVVLDAELRLALREVPDPTAGEGQTLVQVRAAGVNYADVLIREGRYPQAPALPFVPGSEIAGETPDGRRVIAFVRTDGGGYSDDLGMRLNSSTPWTRAIDAAAAVDNQALVALLAGLGMQGDSWQRMTARHLYHIVGALNRVGMNAEARMIAAEAVARG